MGHSRESKSETHEKIVARAAKRLRETGIAGISVADLMQEVGLTVGGFYKHFASREDLVAEALQAMTTGWDEAFAEAAQRERSPETLYDKLVDSYLALAHRDAPGEGCPFAALGSDLARSGDKARSVATQKLERVIDKLSTVVTAPNAAAARAQAIITYSALVGAVALARSTNDDALSREILTTVRKLLKSDAAHKTRSRSPRSRKR